MRGKKSAAIKQKAVIAYIGAVMEIESGRLIAYGASSSSCVYALLNISAIML